MGTTGIPVEHTFGQEFDGDFCQDILYHLSRQKTYRMPSPEVISKNQSTQLFKLSLE